jgi:hypothetical protein
MPPKRKDPSLARLGRHLATAALLLVVAAHYLAVALPRLFVLYPLLAHLSDQKLRPGEIAAALVAVVLLATILM